MNDVLCWIEIGVIVCVVFVLFVGGLCWIAKRSDHISDKQYEAYCREEKRRMQEKAQKTYEKYRERFANDYGKTIEEATECQAVKNYKAYLEEQYSAHGVKIREEI